MDDLTLVSAWSKAHVDSHVPIVVCGLLLQGAELQGAARRRRRRAVPDRRTPAGTTLVETAPDAPEIAPTGVSQIFGCPFGRPPC